MAILTDSATALMRGLRAEVRQQHPGGRVIVAVDGVAGSGTSAFADGLAEAFAADSVAVFRASIDAFRAPSAEGEAGAEASAEGLYRDAYDYAAFRRILIEPFRSGSATFRTAASESADAPEPDAPADAVLIVDGLFLNRPELRGIWTWSVWLHVPAEIAYSHLAEGEGTDPDPEAAVNAPLRQAQALYARDADPRSTASAIVDNSFPGAPQRIFGDFC